MAGVAPRSSERKRFGETATEWLDTVERYGSRRAWGVHAKALAGPFGDVFLDRVTPREVQHYLDALTHAPGYVNSRRDVLIHTFDHAIRKGYAVTNPARDTRRRSTRVRGTADLEVAPQKALTEAQAVAYLGDLQTHSPELYPLIALQFHLGCRFAEVSSLEWRDVELERGTVTIRRGQVAGRVGPTKGRKARLAGIGPACVRMLLEHRARMLVEQWPSYESLVFPRPPHFASRSRASDHWPRTTVQNHVRAALVRVGLGDLACSTHAARHTFVTLASEFAAESVLRKVVGHASAQVHQQYQHAHEAQVINLAEELERRLSATGASTGASGSGAKRDP